MTEKLFFDTDCISSFLWVKEENILFKLYYGRIVLPKEVYVELLNPSIPHIKHKVNQLCSIGDILTAYLKTDITPKKLKKYFEKGGRKINKVDPYDDYSLTVTIMDPRNETRFCRRYATQTEEVY